MKRSLAVIIFALATFSLAGAQRLSEVARPENYKLSFTPNLEVATFEGDETISIQVRGGYRLSRHYDNQRRRGATSFRNL
jgi:hypothetical protein